MSNVNDWNNDEVFQLKECYDLAAKFETLDIVKEILWKKSKKIGVPENYIPAQTDEAHQETDMQIISEAIYRLSLEGFTASEGAGFNYAYKINNLPSSAEKEYVLTLFSLRNGMNTAQRLEALRHISEALSYSPNDPRYIALANVLQDINK